MSEICTTCGLPKELCVCETIARESQKIVVRTENKKFRKVYTVVTGFDEKQVNLKEIAKVLKNALACGGTAKDGAVELQGDHRQRVRRKLVELGFNPEMIEIR